MSFFSSKSSQEPVPCAQQCPRTAVTWPHHGQIKFWNIKWHNAATMDNIARSVEATLCRKRQRSR